MEGWNTGIAEGWERNLDHSGKAFFLKPIIPSFRSKVERPRVQRVKAHHPNMPPFQHSGFQSILPYFQYSTLKTSPSHNHLLVFYDRKLGDKVLKGLRILPRIGLSTNAYRGATVITAITLSSLPEKAHYYNKLQE